MSNKDIKTAAKQANVPLWRLAEEVYHMTDSQFSRKLRYELPEAEKQKLLEAIERLKEV